MKTKISLLLLSVIITISCTSKKGNSDSLSFGEATIDEEFIEQDFMEWWTYYSKDIILSADFIPLDPSLTEIPKGQFLDLLTSGIYIPIKLKSEDDNIYLKLYALTEKADQGVARTIINQAIIYSTQYLREGTPFPEFNYTTLEGINYNTSNTEDTFIVLKCWFIGCTACVKEFPELNKLVDNYQEQDNVLFISLAHDAEDDLRKFLKKKEFKYSVASVDEDYMPNELKTNVFPTHFIIDQKGTIKKVVNSYHELELALKNEIPNDLL